MEKELNINGNIYRLVEENKLEVGKWYNYENNFSLVISKDLRSVGFWDGKWEDDDNSLLITDLWKSANMEEVKKLLFKEAEKRGFKDGIKYNGMTIAKEHVLKLPLHTNENHLFDDKWNVLFDFKSGQWAEIIEEKPLYTNSYGTEFFEWDDFYFVLGEPNNKKKIIHGTKNDTMSKGGYYSEAMTERECHRYIDENWDELNK